MRTNKLLKFLPLALLVFATSCGSKSEENAQEVQSEARKVRVEQVKLESVDQISSFTATIEANTVNNITSAMGGRIRTISVDVGSRVAKGQVLATMDATTLSQQEIQLANLKQDYNRYKELFEVGGISQQQLDQLKVQLDVTQTAIDNLSENTKLISPISGVVTARNFDAGDVAMGSPILTIENINPVKVVINVSEKLYSSIFKGMDVEVEADALAGERFAGKVSLIYPTIDPVSHTFLVEIEVKNNDLKLRPGMFSRVYINFGAHDRPLVADKAIRKQTGSNDRFVFVERDGKAYYTLVELGVRIGDKYEIISGLNSGDRIIVEGNSNLIDGNEVEVVQ